MACQPDLARISHAALAHLQGGRGTTASGCSCFQARQRVEIVGRCVGGVLRRSRGRQKGSCCGQTARDRRGPGRGQHMPRADRSESLDSPTAT
jgi:hypothetical protein